MDFLKISLFLILALTAHSSLANSASDEELLQFELAVGQKMAELQESLPNYRFNNFYISVDSSNGHFKKNIEHYSNPEAKEYVQQLLSHLNSELQRDPDFKNKLNRFSTRRYRFSLRGNCVNETCFADSHFPPAYEEPQGLTFEGLKNDEHDRFRVEFLKRFVFLKQTLEQNRNYRIHSANSYFFDTTASFQNDGLIQQVKGGIADSSHVLPMIFPAFWNREVQENEELREMASNFYLFQKSGDMASTGNIDFRNFSQNIVLPSFDGVSAVGVRVLPDRWIGHPLSAFVCQAPGSSYLDEIKLKLAYHPNQPKGKKPWDQRRKFRVIQDFKFKDGRTNLAGGSYSLSWNEESFSFSSAMDTFSGSDFNFHLEYNPDLREANGTFTIRRTNKPDEIHNLKCVGVK